MYKCGIILTLVVFYQTGVQLSGRPAGELLHRVLGRVHGRHHRHVGKRAQTNDKDHVMYKQNYGKDFTKVINNPVQVNQYLNPDEICKAIAACP